MIIYSKVTKFEIPENTVVTFGKFDGIHMGHMALINAASKIAKEHDLKLCIFTFDVLPNVNIHKFDSSVITTGYEKRKMFAESGIDYLVEYPFNEETKSIEPADFIENIICKTLKAKYLVVGSDWRFGCDRKGDCNTLLSYKEQFEYEVQIIEKEKYSEQIISSTWIRKELAQGNMENVNILLGYPYRIIGTVEYGRKIGRELGFPTINIIPSKEKILPPMGVYASRVIIGEKEKYGVTNIGVKPTVDDSNQVNVETHIIDFDDDLYGTEVVIELFHYLRPEMKFDTIEKLASQIEADKNFTKSFFLI